MIISKIKEIIQSKNENQIIGLQYTMTQNKHYHSKLEESGLSKEC